MHGKTFHLRHVGVEKLKNRTWWPKIIRSGTIVSWKSDIATAVLESIHVVINEYRWKITAKFNMSKYIHSIWYKYRNMQGDSNQINYMYYFRIFSNDSKMSKMILWDRLSAQIKNLYTAYCSKCTFIVIKRCFSWFNVDLICTYGYKSFSLNKINEWPQKCNDLLS